jgi:hypothetical protein
LLFACSAFAQGAGCEHLSGVFESRGDGFYGADDVAKATPSWRMLPDSLVRAFSPPATNQIHLHRSVDPLLFTRLVIDDQRIHIEVFRAEKFPGPAIVSNSGRLADVGLQCIDGRLWFPEVKHVLQGSEGATGSVSQNRKYFSRAANGPLVYREESDIVRGRIFKSRVTTFAEYQFKPVLTSP